MISEAISQNILRVHEDHMIYVKEGFKNRNLIQERQTIPRAFVYELSALVLREGGENYVISLSPKCFVLSLWAHMHACMQVCVCVCVL